MELNKNTRTKPVETNKAKNQSFKEIKEELDVRKNTEADIYMEEVLKIASHL